MNCTNCQKTIPDDADFCKHCGAPAPFSSGINYHPETLFANETVGGSASLSASTEKAMSEMEARLNEKLHLLIPNHNPKKHLWSQIQSIAVLVLVAGMIVGAFLLAQLITRLDQINVQLETAAIAASEMKISLEGLAQIQETQESMQAELSTLLEAQRANDAEKDTVPHSLIFQIILHLNYDEAGGVKNLDPVTMSPGDVLSLATLPVPEREGYELIGWNRKKDGSGDKFAPDAFIGYFGSDVELYAQWKSVDPAPETTDAPVG